MSDEDLIMPIHRAIRQGNLPEVIRLIADKKSLLQMWTPFGTWLQDAASKGQIEIVKWLISQSLDVNAFNESNECPPVTKASARGHVEIVRFLIESGAVLDTSDSVRNPLFAAIVGGISDAHTAVAKLLIESGIDTSVKYEFKNWGDVDALAYAKEWGRSEIVRLLEEL